MIIHLVLCYEHQNYSMLVLISLFVFCLFVEYFDNFNLRSFILFVYIARMIGRCFNQ
jgi:hypothetical protein